MPNGPPLQMENPVGEEEEVHMILAADEMEKVGGGSENTEFLDNFLKHRGMED